MFTVQKKSYFQSCLLVCINLRSAGFTVTICSDHYSYHWVLKENSRKLNLSLTLDLAYSLQQLAVCLWSMMAIKCSDMPDEWGLHVLDLFVTQFVKLPAHQLTHQKGVHQLRYFLPLMRKFTPYLSRQLVFFARGPSCLLHDVVYALGTGSTSTSVHPFNV